MRNTMWVGIAADHEGFELKNEILLSLRELDIEIIDYGAMALNRDDDYPDFVIPLARGVASQEVNRGIAICGSGIGACIAANKIKNVRASVIQDTYSAQQGVEDDNMNIICLGANLVKPSMALKLIHRFLISKFVNEIRFQRRLNKISILEEGDIQYGLQSNI